MEWALHSMGRWKWTALWASFPFLAQEDEAVQASEDSLLPSGPGLLHGAQPSLADERYPRAQQSLGP